MNLTFSPFLQASSSYSSSDLSCLPTTLILRICSLLEKSDLLRGMLICKQWKETILNSQVFWLLKKETNRSVKVGETEWLKSQDFFCKLSCGRKKDIKDEVYVQDYLASDVFKYLDDHFAKKSPEGRLGSLGECGCSVLNRVSYPKKRKFFDGKVQDGLIKIFKSKINAKESLMKIAFLASGRLHNEFEILIKFFHALFLDPERPAEMRIRVHLIDEIYVNLDCKKEMQKTIDTFEKEICLNMPQGFSLELGIFNSAFSYRRLVDNQIESRPDCLIALDPSRAAAIYYNWAYNILPKYGFAAGWLGTGYKHNNTPEVVLHFFSSRVMEDSEKKSLFVRKVEIITLFGDKAVCKDQQIFLNLRNEQAVEPKHLSHFNAFLERGVTPKFHELREYYKKKFLPGEFFEFVFKAK